MKKSIAARCLVGAPIGLAISTVITIIISLAAGGGGYYPVAPELASDCGTEINAVVLQAVCSLLYGAAWGGASAIWEKDGWSLLRQSVTHLLICSAATFPVAYLMRWMSHTAGGVLLYFGIFFAVYFLIWLWQYSAMKKRVAELNGRVRENNLPGG
jgi:hypothetical protein